MELQLYILESRGPKTPLQEGAAIVPSESQPPEGYAVVDKVSIPEKVSSQLAPLFAVGATTQFTRDQLLGLLAMMGRIGHSAGLELARSDGAQGE